MGLPDWFRDHWKGFTLAVAGLTALGYVVSQTYKAPEPAKQVVVHYGGEAIGDTTLDIDNLEGKVGGKSIPYAEAVKKASALDTKDTEHFINPIAEDGSTLVENNDNNSAIVQYILDTTHAGINAKDVSNITIHAYTSEAGTVGFYEVQMKDGKAKIVLGTDAEKVFDHLDNLKDDNSWEKVSKQIVKEKKTYGNLEAILQVMPDNVVDIFPKLKQWANSQYNIIYNGTNASELLKLVDKEVMNRIGQNFTKAKEAVQTYVDFVGNSVSWNGKYANFTALNETVKGLTFKNINSEVGNITDTLKTAMGSYIADQKALVIGDTYAMLWNTIASDIGINADVLKDKFGLKNSTAMNELEWKFGKVQGMFANADQATYLKQTKNDNYTIYLNLSKSAVADLEAQAETYAIVADEFRTDLTADLILNTTESARTSAIGDLKDIPGQYSWLGGFYGKNITEDLTDKIKTNASYNNTAWGKAILEMSNLGADKIEVYKTGDGGIIIQGYDNGQRITTAGKEGAYKASGADYDVIQKL